jgi:glycerol-3-phosphate dehydrogenase subunit B
MTFDVVVIGAGLAGLTCALRLARAGARVLIVARGAGSLHLGGATIDVLGYVPERVDSPARTLPSFVTANPDHPYARIGTESVSASLEWLTSQDELGRFAGNLERNLLLPTAVGSVKPSAVVPAGMAAGDLRAEPRLVVAGFRQLKDFYPAYVADNLSAAGFDARGVTLDVALPAPLDREADVGALGFARSFEDREFLKTVMVALEGHVGTADAVGLPAVLGRTTTTTVQRELADGLGCGVFEIPTLPPSVPGIRLYEAMSAAIRSAGGRIVVGSRVIGRQVLGTRLEAVEADAGARVATYRAGTFVLATGGVSAGGIAMDSRWRISETVLDLPLANVPADGSARFKPEYFARQPVAKVGVDIDQDCRPLHNGEPVYDNLFAAGATVGGAEPWREKSGNGLSLATGWRAAQSILDGGF